MEPPRSNLTSFVFGQKYRQTIMKYNMYLSSHIDRHSSLIAWTPNVAKYTIDDVIFKLSDTFPLSYNLVILLHFPILGSKNVEIW